MPVETTSSVPESAPSGADYFSVFALPRKLGLDERALERAFYKRSREVHPDRFAQASPSRQQWSLEQTSLLNDAYRALKEPIARTEYLLRLEGVTLPETAAAADAQKAKGAQPNQVAPELLAEVFELNMQLEEMRMNAQTGEDDPQLRKELEAARSEFEAQLASIEAEIRGEWVRWDAGADAGDEAAQAASAKAMAATLDKRRYVRNLVRDVHEALGS